MDDAVVEALAGQHAEEAAFLWAQRDGAACSWRYDLAGLADLDDRLDAHLAALRQSPSLRRAARGILSSADRGERFVLAWTLLLDEPEGLVALCEEADDPDDPDALDPVVAALAWHPSRVAAPQVAWLLDPAHPPFARRLGVAAAAAHRDDPGASLVSLVTSDDVALRRRALRAAGELGRSDLLGVLARRAQDDDDPIARGEAAWSAVLLGHVATVGALWEAAPWMRDGGRRVGSLAARRAPRAEAVARMLAGELPTRAVIEASVMLGDAVMVPWLLAQMRDDATAGRAGAAFEAITGCALVEAGLAEAPDANDLSDDEAGDGDRDGADDDPADLDPEEALPKPDPDAVARWWAEHPLPVGTRLTRGAPWDAEATARMLRVGDQAQRARAALDACVREGVGLRETRAPAWRQ